MAEGASRPVPGAAVVCLREDMVLLVQRGQEPNRGRWSFPGGKIEAGETGNPHSTDFQNRDASQHKTTNAEINAAEKGNPDAVQPQK